MDFFEVVSLPDQEFDKGTLLELLGRRDFLIVYDFARRSTVVALDESEAVNIETAGAIVPGVGFSRLEGYGEIMANLQIFSVFRKSETIPAKLLGDVFTIPKSEGFLGLLFERLDSREIGRSKMFVERLLGDKVVRETSSVLNGSLASRSSNSQQRELFGSSEERMLLSDVLESMNLAVLSGMLVYNVYAVFAESRLIEEYVATKFLVLDRLKVSSTLAGCANTKKPKSLPVGVGHAKNFAEFYGVKRLKYSLKTLDAEAGGAVGIGTFMNEGIQDTGKIVAVDPSLFNLGFIITGLPGSGKTMEAMGVVDALMAKNTNKRIILIAPTDEWDEFAGKHGMYLIRIYQDSVPINFFRCAENVDPSMFYEDLAMLLSSASDAGPYRNPMEKCMLNAFKNVYKGVAREPDPVRVYWEIEEAIIRLHAKRTNVGVKYTKHGENIKSALENLRSIIRRPEYSSRIGVRMEDLVEKGVVFDLSGVSNKIKPSIYALLLNQAYMLAGRYDTNGEDELRLLICLEESQSVLGQRNSAAVEDLRYRIQDFRKRGIGLILLAHNADDIDEKIRRLCQLKLYLKQSPDAADAAARDLIFTYADSDAVIRKLRHLDSRIGAFNYLVKKSGEKIACDTVFVRTMDYSRDAETGRKGKGAQDIIEYMEHSGINSPLFTDTRLNIGLSIRTEKREVRPEELFVRIDYLAEPIMQLSLAEIPKEGMIVRLVKDRAYEAELVNRNDRVISKIRFMPKEAVELLFPV